MTALSNKIAEVDRKAEDALEGVAVALSVADPVLRGNEVFGMRMNFGSFSGHHAIGGSVIGVLDSNLMGGGERLSISGGLGVSLNDGKPGGRVGVQLTW